MILGMTFFTLAFAGLCWMALIAHREGLGEPIRMIGRWLIAFADTLEDSLEFSKQRFGETHNDLRAQFPASRPRFSNRELTSISATPDFEPMKPKCTCSKLRTNHPGAHAYWCEMKDCELVDSIGE